MAALARRAAANPRFCAPLQFTSVDMLRTIYRYRDELEEIVRSPEFMLNDYDTLGYMEGDCDDISTFLAAYFLCRGVPVRFEAIIYTPGETQFQHVYPAILQNGNWQPIDLTVAPGIVPHYLERMIEDV